MILRVFLALLYAGANVPLVRSSIDKEGFGYLATTDVSQM
jgi:hypothetical protein